MNRRRPRRAWSPPPRLTLEDDILWYLRRYAGWVPQSIEQVLPDISRWATRLRALGICRVIYPAFARTTNHVEHILHLAWKDRDKKAEHALRNLLPEIRGYKR